MTTSSSSLSRSLSASLQAAAALAAGGQAYPAGTLYVMATPIGNLADLTLRAIHVLTLADAIACEDTRHSAPLLRHLGIDKPLLPVHEHNEREAASGVLARLASGERVVYVSDAGTPAISDPGAALVAAAQQAGYRTMPIPGASSVVTALSVAGDAGGASAGFSFVGFLPVKGNDRAQSVAGIALRPQSQVLFEAPHRIEALAKALADACPDRLLTVCRELTKQFEAVATMRAGEWPSWMKQDAHRSRGEFVLVLHALSAATVASDAESSEEERVLTCLLAALPLRQAVTLAGELTGASKNRLYERALALKAKDAIDDDDGNDDDGPVEAGNAGADRPPT